MGIEGIRMIHREYSNLPAYTENSRIAGLLHATTWRCHRQFDIVICLPPSYSSVSWATSETMLDPVSPVEPTVVA